MLRSLEQAAGCLVVCYSIGTTVGDPQDRDAPLWCAERIGVGHPVPNLHQRHVQANRFDDAGSSSPMIAGNSGTGSAQRRS